MDDWWDEIISIEKKLGEMELDESINYLDSLIHECDDTELLALYLFERAYLKIKGGLPKEGLLNMNRALEWILDLKKSDMKGYLLTRIGNIYLHTGEIYTAIETFREASKNFSEDSGEYIKILNGMGEAYKRMEDIEKSLLFYKEAYRRSRDTGYMEGKIFSAENIAEVYSLEGDRKSAEIWLDRAINAAEDGEEDIKIYLNLCKNMLEGNVKEAIKIAENLKNKPIPYPYMVADAFYYYSNFLPEDLQREFLKEALLIYADIGDGNMKDNCMRRLEE